MYLPVSILSRVELWLTYRGLKNASSIQLRQKFSKNSSATKRVMKWITEAGLFFEIDAKNKELLHVAKSQELVQKMKVLHWSENKKDIVFRGIQYGFPKEAVHSFSKDHTTVNTFTCQDVTKFPWKPYVRYMVRIGHEREDSLVAKKWAEVIRYDVPVLADWFEQKLKNL